MSTMIRPTSRRPASHFSVQSDVSRLRSAMAAAPSPPRLHPSTPMESPPPLRLPPVAEHRQRAFDGMRLENCAAGRSSGLWNSETTADVLAVVRCKRKRALEKIEHKSA